MLPLFPHELAMATLVISDRLIMACSFYSIPNVLLVLELKLQEWRCA